jgi:uncharacterized membrane protein
MFLRAPEAHSRSFLKAVSWRVLGSIDTFVISYLVTGRLVFAASIASVETFTKIILFYFHERAWALAPFGRADRVVAAEGAAPEAKSAPAQPAPPPAPETAIAH